MGPRRSRRRRRAGSPPSARPPGRRRAGKRSMRSPSCALVPRSGIPGGHPLKASHGRYVENAESPRGRGHEAGYFCRQPTAEVGPGIVRRLTPPPGTGLVGDQAHHRAKPAAKPVVTARAPGGSRSMQVDQCSRGVAPVRWSGVGTRDAVPAWPPVELPRGQHGASAA